MHASSTGGTAGGVQLHTEEPSQASYLTVLTHALEWLSASRKPLAIHSTPGTSLAAAHWQLNLEASARPVG